ncbi:MAG TPA: class I SAM-dependent methyltransferase [Anaerolineae bacterium]|nr:class I SAM-dependent methyltransferase [Anaerolineae bacterium]
MAGFGRRRKLALLPNWLSHRIEVNRIETLRMLAEAQAAIPNQARVLDAGSGEGRYIHYFDHTQYTGVDLAVGDNTWDYTGLDALADLRTLPFPDNTFDAAVCIQTLEHVDEPMKVTQEIGRVLKPGGRYYLSAPMCWHQHQKPHDFFRYTSFGFRHLIENSQMKVVELRPWGGYFWFLSFNLQLMHARIFPKTKTKLGWWLQLPFQIIVQAIFFVILPVIFYYLDRIDKDKDHTLGWCCIAEKIDPNQ